MHYRSKTTISFKDGQRCPFVCECNRTYKEVTFSRSEGLFLFHKKVTSELTKFPVCEPSLRGGSLFLFLFLILLGVINEWKKLVSSSYMPWIRFSIEHKAKEQCLFENGSLKATWFEEKHYEIGNDGMVGHKFIEAILEKADDESLFSRKNLVSPMTACIWLLWEIGKRFIFSTFWLCRGIDLRLNTKATAIDTTAQQPIMVMWLVMTNWYWRLGICSTNSG